MNQVQQKKCTDLKINLWVYTVQTVYTLLQFKEIIMDNLFSFETFEEALNYVSNKLPPGRGMEVKILCNLACRYIVTYEYL